MITKLVSSKSVIAKVIADLDLKDDNLRITDLRHWIGEAIEKIGSPQQLIHKVSGIEDEPILTLSNHQVALPTNLYKLEQVAYSPNENGPWYSMRKATGSFDVWGEETGATTPEMLIPDEALIVLVKTLYNIVSDIDAYAKLNSDPNIRTTLTALVNAGTYVIPGYKSGFLKTNISDDYQYTTKPGYIMTNVPDGYLKLSYYAIPRDSDYYPLVPETQSYFEACYWYIVMKLKYPEYLRGTLNRQTYYDMKNSWNYYCKQAYGDAMMPSSDDMESLKNNWLRIIPVQDEHDSFYSTIGEKQRIYNAAYE